MIYLFTDLYLEESQENQNSAKALDLHLQETRETDLCKKPSFRCRMEKWRTWGKPMEASQDWKPNAHKYWDRESNMRPIAMKNEGSEAGSKKDVPWSGKKKM